MTCPRALVRAPREAAEIWAPSTRLILSQMRGAVHGGVRSRRTAVPKTLSLVSRVSMSQSPDDVNSM